MNAKEYYSYHRAISLNRERLLELERIMLGTMDHVVYETIDFQNVTVKYDSIKALTSSDNFGNRKVKQLYINGYHENGNMIQLEFECPRWNSFFFMFGSCSGEYLLPNESLGTQLCIDLEQVMRKSTERYWPLYKISLFYPYIVLLLLFSLYNEYAKTPLNSPYLFWYVSFTNAWAPIARIAFTLFYIAILWGINEVIIRGGVRKIFPLVNFVWGEERSRYQRRAELRKNIFWSVIISCILSVLGSLVVCYI